VLTITPGVQDLHADPAALIMDRPRDRAVLLDLARAREFAREGLGPAGTVRRDAAADQQARAAARARRELRGKLGEVARAVFEPRMHRSHDDAIRERREPEIERGKQVPVFHRRSVMPRGPNG
jgi:hypothetical protein